jgi:hypothetical protein
MSSWKPHYYSVGAISGEFESTPSEPMKHRQHIEPWLSAVFQSEHLSLLVGNGFTSAIAQAAGVEPISMETIYFGLENEDKVIDKATESAKVCGRIEPNIEDQIRTVIDLIKGLEIVDANMAIKWREALNDRLSSFVRGIVKLESDIGDAAEREDPTAFELQDLLTSFLLSFASRTASRERLNIFTTNYDRLIEFGCDIAGIRVIDRFVGGLSPIFRSSRLNVDIHYNPPGIRGEPRYLEGVVKLTKLHGSIDWRTEGKVIKRYHVPFGAIAQNLLIPDDPFDSVIIYPNPAKDIETCEYPYAELFRDLSASLCIPNSALVTYGYGFGDDHINRVIRDMLTIPSTHLVIISYDEASGRIPQFCNQIGHEKQISLLIGNHFGDLPTIIKYYLPKPAIDQITWRKAELIRRRLISYKRETDESEAEESTTADKEGET